MKTKRILKGILSSIIITSCLFINSCEPSHCAWCDKTVGPFSHDHIEICTDDQDELYDLMDYTERVMGYDCELEED